jgi:uncharacterized protein DUF5681
MRSFDDDGWSEDDDEHQVGYGRPPKDSRFKKGRSGNPSGKRGAKRNSLTFLKKALLQPIPVKLDGRRGRVTKLEAIATLLVNKAMQGNYQIIKLLLSYFLWLHLELVEPIRQGGGLSPEVGDAIRRALLGLPNDADSVAEEKAPVTEHAQIAVTLEAQPLDEKKCARLSEVGFGRPPVKSRFRKGQSGNPAGRPPTAKSFEKLIRRLLVGKVRLIENGCTRTATRWQVILEQIVNQATRGKIRFLKLLLEYIPSVDNVLVRERKLPRNLVEIFTKSLYESRDSDD